MAIESRNPATEELIETFEPLREAEISTRLDRAVRAFQDHRKSTFEQRAKAMQAAGRILLDEKDAFGRLISSEMGKTLKSAVAEVAKCASICRYYAETAEDFLADEKMASDAARSFVRYLPMGPILAVMPWNFPFWQVFRFAAPALMAGNVGLLKHASNVPRSALAIEDIFRRAGFAEGCFQTLLIGSDKVEKILRDERVRAATLTGSEHAGAAVAATAGAEIKHTVLELGGSDPFIVMPSADLDKAVGLAVTARTINNGQSCIAAKRFIVHAEIYDAFAEQFVAGFEALEVGDPMEDDTDIGPLAMRQIRDEVDNQVRRSIDAGATRLSGAERMDGKGYFYRPGILADVPESAPAFSEELFGPVAILFKAASFDEAIELGNATRFGLGSALFSEDPSEIERAATNLDAGATFINSMVASDPRLPFGGVKSSGYGRELSRDGIREFVNRKTISIA
jgi:succinate-semialdehyde dehydrogenase/glutarate-semialdehyde dehydrogenase